MKKFLCLLPFLLFSCKKETTTLSTSESLESTGIRTEFKETQNDSAVPELQTESSSAEIPEKNKFGRKTVADTIYVKADAASLPLKLHETFTNERQQLILKIENFSGPQISASVVPENKMMNIRISQIRTPDGEWDGPFGRSLENYPVEGKGEILLRIGKSLMASGEASGTFTVEVE